MLKERSLNGEGHPFFRDTTLQLLGQGKRHFLFLMSKMGSCVSKPRLKILSVQGPFYDWGTVYYVTPELVDYILCLL